MSDFTLYITQQDIDNINKFKDSDNWSNYKDKIHETDLYDATYLGNKYGIDIDFTPINIGRNEKIYITKTRKKWYIQKLEKEYGISNINGENMRHVKPSGSKRETDKKEEEKKDTRKKTKFIPPPFELTDIFKFDYNEMFNCEEDKKFDKIDRLEFNHIFYNHWQTEIYKRYQERYYNEKQENKDNVFSTTKSVFQKISTYIRENGLSIDRKDEHNYVCGSVICNIALMTAKYIKTGIFDTDLTWINKMTLSELNEEDNTYMLFLILQCFSSKYHWKTKVHEGEKLKDWWPISLLRRRDHNSDSRTLGIIPIFEYDANGYISYKLY